LKKVIDLAESNADPKIISVRKLSGSSAAVLSYRIVFYDSHVQAPVYPIRRSFGVRISTVAGVGSLDRGTCRKEGVFLRGSACS